jgi:endonuclease G, mitochondrial
MAGLKRWHWGALLPLLWFGYHLWSDSQFQHERETRFTGRTATEDRNAPHSNRDSPNRTAGTAEPTHLLQAPPREAGVEPPVALSTGLPVHSARWQIQVLRNAGYTVGYSPKARLPLWVFFRLDTSHPLFPLYRRPHIEFYPDERVSDPVYSSEYTHTGYQRGHMATSATIGIYFGSAAQAETFRLTNVVPQLGWNNEGIWNTLERIECDDYPKRYGVTESVCGPVLGNQRMGRLPVPRALYKIIERPDGKCVAFLIPQDGPEIPSSDLDHELTSVAQIEQVTGLVFDFVPESQKQTIARRRW